jgi:hypothetical protein
MQSKKGFETDHKLRWFSGTLTESTKWNFPFYTCSDPKSTGNYCAAQIWKPEGHLGFGTPDGTILFVRMDCVTRTPLAAEYQDPVYNMPGVALDHGELDILMQTWVENTCAVKREMLTDWLGLAAIPTSVLEIMGRGILKGGSLSDGGKGLYDEVSQCGKVLEWGFDWTPDDSQYQWRFWARYPDVSPGCVGEKLAKAGGTRLDQCVD